MPGEQGWSELSQEGCQQKEASRVARPCDRLVAVRPGPVPHLMGHTAPGSSNQVIPEV